MFVVASDDLDWCKKHLANSSDVVVVDSASSISDFALLSSMDYHIMSFGTFGTWSVFLSEAKLVAYPAPFSGKRHYIHHAFDSLNLPNFVQISFTPSNSTLI